MNGRTAGTLLLLSLLSPGASARAPTAGYWGMAVGLYPKEAARQGLAYPPPLKELRALGAGHALLNVHWVQQGITASRLAPGSESLGDAQLIEAMDVAARAGLEVVLVPQVRLAQGEAGDWRGRIRPANPDAWWHDYRRFILHYARLAERQGVSLFAIGSELSSMSEPVHSPRWQRLAREVRRQFSGPIAFVANHDALDRRAPMAWVDVVGVSAYFPLTSSLDPSETELKARWRDIALELAELQGDTDKPLVLFEVGYPSRDGAARRPWDYTRGNPVDLEEQRMAYGACVDALVDAPWISGALFWQWFGRGGRHDRHYTPRGKPALNEVRRLFRVSASRNPD